MSLWVKIVTIVLWVIVICTLVFTAFRFSWFAERGTWIVKDTFDYNLTLDQFYDSMVVVCLWFIVFMAIATLTEYVVFLYRQKHPKSEEELAVASEKEAKKAERKKKRLEILEEAKEAAKDKVVETVANKITESTEKVTDAVKEVNTSEAIAAKLRSMYYR